MSEVPSSGQTDVVVAGTAEPSAPAPEPVHLEPRLKSMMVLAVLIFAAGIWSTAHFAVKWLALPLAVAVFPAMYALYRFIAEKNVENQVVPWVAKQVGRITRTVLERLAVVIAAVMLTVGTVEIRGLPEGTRITVPALTGGEESELAEKDQPLRLHFFLPFRKVTIASDRHAKTVRRIWPIIPYRLSAAELTPLPSQAGVLLRLPLAAQRYLDGGEFVIAGKRYPTNEHSGSIVIGDYPRAAIEVAERKWLFPGNVSLRAQATAVAVWSRPLSAPAPDAQSFRVTYAINGIEVAAADAVRVPPSGLADIEMKWTGGKTR
jgi:hypothetical protein